MAQSTITFSDMKMGGRGDEFDAQVGPEVFVTSGGLSYSNISDSLKILENRNEWPSGSDRFLRGITTFMGMN